jgi:hypothetical protein
MTRRIGVAVSTTLAAGVLSLAIALPASATPPPKDTPISGDDRATPHGGNTTVCDDPEDPNDANLPGDIVTVSFVYVYNDEKEKIKVTITSVPSDIQLTGIVVKGAPGYNVYPPSALTDLRSPQNPGGQIPAISHWFACGIKKDTSSSPNNPPSSSSSSSSSSAPAGGSSSSSSAPAAQGSVVSSTELADTGFSATAPLTGAGALIVLGGGLLLALRRTRRRG